MRITAGLLMFLLVFGMSAPLALAEGIVAVSPETSVTENTSTESTTATPDSTTTPDPATTPDTVPADTAATDENAEDEAGITPDSWFYGLDRVLEQVQLTLTQGNAAKAAFLERIATERLAEAELMLTAEEQALAQEMVTEFTNTLQAITENLEAAVLDGTDEAALAEAVASVQALRDGLQLRVEQVLAKLDEELTEDPTEAIDEAGDTATAIDEVSQGDADQAAIKAAIIKTYGLDEDIFEQLADAGLNFGQSKLVAVLVGRVNDGKTAEDDLLTVEEALALRTKGWGQMKKQVGLRAGDLGLAIGHMLRDCEATDPADGEDEETIDEELENTAEVEETETDTETETETEATTSSKHIPTEKHSAGNGKANGQQKNR